MQKMDCISVGIVTRRCVTGPACASISKRKDVLYFLQPLRMSSLLHHVHWVPLWPHQNSMLHLKPCRMCHMLRSHMSFVQCRGMETMLPFIYRSDACSPTHGALCHQWITVPGKMKQHYRQSHAATHAEHAIPAAKLCSRFTTSGSPCEHCGAVTKAPRQHPSKCTVLWQLCVLHLRNHGCGHPGVLRGPSTEVRGCSAEGRASGGHHTRSQSPQTRGGQGQWAPAQRSITKYAASPGSTAERQSLITRPQAGGESTGQIGAPTRNLNQGTEPIIGSPDC